MLEASRTEQAHRILMVFTLLTFWVGLFFVWGNVQLCPWNLPTRCYPPQPPVFQFQQQKIVSRLCQMFPVGYHSQVIATTLGIMRVLIDSLNTLHNCKNVSGRDHEGFLWLARKTEPSALECWPVSFKWPATVITTMLKCNKNSHLGLLRRVPNPPDYRSSLYQMVLVLFQLTNWIFFFKAWQLDLS